MAMTMDGGTREVAGGIAGPVESVIVVGAGMAGLTVGNALAHAGVPVTLLEARDRIGGRTHTADVDGSPVDLGASWIHSPEANPLSRLGAHLGIEQVHWEAFEAALGWDPATGDLVPAEEFGRLFAAADAAVEAFAVSRQGVEGGAGVSDVIADQLTGGGLDDVTRARTAALARLFVEGDSSGRIDDVSSAWFPSNGLVLEGSPMGDVPVGGYRAFVEAFAQGLDITTGVEVSAVSSEAGGVFVQCADGQTLTASHAVVTVPLGVLKARVITFDPPLPPDRVDAIDRLGFGCFDKLVLKFERPFWTEAGVPHVVAVPSSGVAPVHALLGLDSACGDPVLAVFAFGSTHGWIEEADLDGTTERAMELLRGIFGDDVPPPVTVTRSEWSRDPYSRGAYTYLAAGSRPDDLELLGQPHAERILFAGEATGYARVGYVDGALGTGVREAKRLTGREAVEVGRLGR